MADDDSSRFRENLGPRGVWPPPPGASRADVKTCPKCGRKLLSSLSILCNWCGARIDDAEYLAQAAEKRHALDVQLREQVDHELDETARMGVFGRLKVKAKSGDHRKPMDAALNDEV